MAPGLLVSGICVSKQATKEAECLREAKENQVKLHSMTRRTVTMKVSKHCQLGITWYHIPSGGCSICSVMEHKDRALTVELQELETVFGRVPIWVFLWREAGHPCKVCMVICSSDRTQPLGWCSQMELQHWKQHRWQFDQRRDLFSPLVPEGRKHHLAPNKPVLQRHCRKRDLASMCMNLQVIFGISLVQLKVSPWREEVPCRKMLLGGPGNVPPWFRGCCLMFPISESSTSTATKPTAHPLGLLHSSNLEVKVRQLALNYSPKKKKLHWF